MDWREVSGLPDVRDWRARAVELAALRSLIGKARRADPQVPLVRLWHAAHGDEPDQPDQPPLVLYICQSAREPTDHAVAFFPDDGELVCDCGAGRFRRPCAHAGAVFLLIVGGATEPRRGEHG